MQTRKTLRFARFEWKLADMWIGAYWERAGARGGSFVDLWVCLLPCVPLHVRWFSKRRVEDVDVDVPPII